MPEWQKENRPKGVNMPERHILNHSFRGSIRPEQGVNKTRMGGQLISEYTQMTQIIL